AGGATPTERAMHAARCALALRAVLPEETMALATGWDEPASPSDQPVAIGDLIDRAARMLGAFGPSIPDAPSTRRATQVRYPIAVDETTAGLLRTRFDVRSARNVFALWAEREPIEAPRTLLGKPTECIGRDTELRRFEAVFDASVALQSPR